MLPGVLQLLGEAGSLLSGQAELAAAAGEVLTAKGANPAAGTPEPSPPMARAALPPFSTGFQKQPRASMEGGGQAENQ